MGRHGRRDPDPAPDTRLDPATTAVPHRHPVPAARPAYRPARRIAASRGPRVGPTGKVLVAAVAAGAILPALQTLDSNHVADADATTASLDRADLALAAQHQAQGASAAPGGVASVAMPASDTSGPSGGSAGDATDVAALTKAMSVARENGPVAFGQPYIAGDDDSLSGQIAKALGLLGLPQKLAPGVKKIIMHESTGNADAVNDSDSNAAAGTPSKGLMQLIDTTFRNAVLPSLASKGIFDPVANITAGIRTMAANDGLGAVMNGGLHNSSGGYVGYGGAKLPDDGLGRA